MAPVTAMSHLLATIDGLTQDEAATRLRIKGANLLSTKKPPTWWQLLLSVIPNPFNVLLGLLAVISAATPPPQWSTFILLVLMIMISCVVRFWQEYRSSVAAIKLQAGVSTDVRVRRRVNGVRAEEIVVDEKILVPGDILLVDPGTVIPADCMILESVNLQISQSRYGSSWARKIELCWQIFSLTGESEPLRKMIAPNGGKNGGILFELENIAFMGTSAISGSGVALVLRTGDGKSTLNKIFDLS
jgi:P-type Mg2+ transporter